MTRMILRAAAATLAVAAATGAASAADLSNPVAPAPAYTTPSIVAYGFNWTGAYVGANIGGRWVNNDGTGAGIKKFILDSTSLAGGLQAGYLFQTGPMVFGVEGDVTYGKNSRSHDLGGGRKVTTDLDWQSTVRGRAGYAFDRFLAYGTAGLAIASVDQKGTDGAASSSKSSTKLGWTAGAGLEYAVTNNVSVRGEYLYSDFGKDSISYPGTGIGKQKQDITSHLARLGVNFKF